MRVLITYDVNTATREGERRLRRVARACVDYGQRVQKSVFECSLSETQFERLRLRLLGEMDMTRDSLRIYRLPEDVEPVREVHGMRPEVDFEGPLVL